MLIGQEMLKMASVMGHFHLALWKCLHGAINEDEVFSLFFCVIVSCPIPSLGQIKGLSLLLLSLGYCRM